MIYLRCIRKEVNLHTIDRHEDVHEDNIISLDYDKRHVKCCLAK